MRNDPARVAGGTPQWRLEDLRVDELTELYNMRAPAPIRRFRTRAEAVRSVREMLTRLGLEIVVDDGAPSVRQVARGGPDPEYPDSAVVRLLVPENPKKEGSAAASRFALYREGMTVGQYLDACVMLQGRARVAYRMDLRWDVAHGYIRIVAAR